jgi:DNA polymerase III subunit epsilon
MNLVVIFDTETTGLPNWQQPSESDCQPHIVQIAALLVDLDTRKVIQSMDVIIKPDGWVIPDEASAINGITTEYALQVGIPESLALQMFLELSLNRKRVAHNTTFDNRIIRIATKRFCDESIQEQWHSGEYECTMIGSRKIMGGKQPTLAEAYKHFTGKEIQNAHTAIGDVNACMEVYFAVKDHLAAVA